MSQLYPEYYNDVFGPIMQPGSSSHMAGPCRLGYLCNSLLNEDLSSIDVILDEKGSFTGTFGTLNEDLGMLNGAYGRLPEHPDFFNIKTILGEKNISYNFLFSTITESDHLNAVKFVLKGINGTSVSLTGNSIGGGMVEIVNINGYEFKSKGDTWTLLSYDEKCDEKLFGNNVILDTGIVQKNHHTMYWYKLEEMPSPDVCSHFDNYNILKPVLPVTTTSRKKEQLFSTMEEWRNLAHSENKSMVDVAIDYEVAASGWTHEEVFAYMQNVIQPVLHRRTHAIYEEETKWIHTPFDKRYAEAWKKSENNNILNGVIFKAIDYMNAASPTLEGVQNVPGPMGPGGGFIYAVLSALKDEYNYTEQDLTKALFIAAGVGAICYTRSEPTGEVVGCAGELGCCAAMAAASAVQLLGGTPEQMENAATFSLQATIGWPCDIIPGSGLTPCVSRSLYAVTMSLVYAQFAMIGGNPLLSFHEELDIMDHVGRNMSSDLLCTAKGGHCLAPSAQKCMLSFKNWHQKTLL